MACVLLLSVNSVASGAFPRDAEHDHADDSDLNRSDHSRDQDVLEPHGAGNNVQNTVVLLFTVLPSVASITPA